MAREISKFARAKVQVGLKHPFFATLMMMTPHVMDCSIPTACTNMISIRYNPKFLESLPSIEMVMFVIVHEMGHIFLKHGMRRGLRDPHLWNIACDHAINLMLDAAGFTLWPKCHADPQYIGMTAEAIYEQLVKDEAQKPKQPQQQPQQPGSGSGSGQPGQGQPSPGSAPPPQGPYSHLPSDPLGDDVQEPAGPGNQQARDEAEREVNQRVARAAAVARMAGKMPGEIERLLGDYFDPPLRWQDIFSEYMLRLVNDDESWNRRNRRFGDIYLPGRKSTRMGEVVVIGDTSGSMGEDVFGMIAVQLNEICESCKPERVRVIWADDTDCALEEIFEPDDEILLHPKGGGGTDMRKPLRFVEQYDPDVVLLITDGWTPWPKDTPYPLIVLCNTEKPIPIGDVVRVKV